MGLKLSLLQFAVPPGVKKAWLRELFEFTAYAFECEVPDIGGLSHTDLLLRYAQFTRDEAENSIKNGDDIEEIRRRLRENALLLGQGIKARYRLRTLGDAFRLARVLFRVLRIDFQGDPSGEIVVRRCFFSSHFSKEVCSIVSSFDEGLLAGLSGAGVLTFIDRLTDCSSCCRARFVLKAPGRPAERSV